jgi:hypothetical protein
VIIIIAIIIGWLVISTWILYKIHEKHFLEAYNHGRQHEAENQEPIRDVRNQYFFNDAYEMGRRHAKKEGEAE